MPEIGLGEQIECVRRWLGHLEWIYPRWVDCGRVSQLMADTEVARMRAALETLVELQRDAVDCHEKR